MPLVFAPTGNSFAARYNAESGFLIAPQRPSLGFNEHPMVDRYILGRFKPGIKMYPNQTGKGSISLAQKLSQDDSTRRCPQNCESTCETYTRLDPSNLVKTTFADPQSPSEGINESSTGKPGETKEKTLTLSHYVAPSRVTLAFSTQRDVCLHVQPMPWDNSENCVFL